MANLSAGPRSPPPARWHRCCYRSRTAWHRQKSANDVSAQASTRRRDRAARQFTVTHADYGDRVAQRAYELYLARGRADGRDFDDWLTAERELTNDRDRQGILRVISDRRQPFVLVVDDDLDTRELYRACFDTNGYRTAEAGTGSQAIASAVEIVPDVLLTDYVLPDIDGLAIAQRLKADPRTARDLHHHGDGLRHAGSRPRAQAPGSSACCSSPAFRKP